MNMAKILFIADTHIHFPKKVPKEWQRNRLTMLISEINKVDCDFTILGGDTLDSAKPTPAELEMFFDFLAHINKGGLIYSGNHEMQTKNHSILWDFKSEIERATNFKVVSSGSYDGFDIIDYPDLHKPFDIQNSVCFTHVRGAIPPHVVPEVDLAKFSKYSIVLAGDLHSFKNSQENIIYPGSPISTSMHRVVPEGSNGMILIDTASLSHEWIDLSHLPHLIKQTVVSTDDIVDTPYHYTMYELKGAVDDLAKVGKLDLLDKKVNIVEVKPATIDFSATNSLSEEMHNYLVNIAKVSNPEPLLKRFNEYASSRETKI